MSEPQALRVLVITSRPLVALKPDSQNGLPVRRSIALKPVWHVRHELERALKGTGGSVVVRYLARATTVAVQTALLDSYDVVRFVGHDAEDGRLLLEQENALADLLSFERAAQMLRGSQARLVVISACHSGKAAQALRQAEIANVVAVDEQFPIADRAAEGGALNNLRAVHHSQGRWAEAIAAYEQDLAICRELGDRHGEGITLNSLEIVYQAQREKTGFRVFFAAIHRVTQSVAKGLKWW